MKDLRIFNYLEASITFEFGNGDVMVNATDMAKPFGKRPNDWLSLSSTLSFLRQLSDTRNPGNTHKMLIETITGNYSDGRAQGTWMHEDVALEFARWLNPVFAIWCNDRIKELIKHGATAINPEDLLNPDYVIRVMIALKEERAQKELAQAELKEQAPKVALANAISETNGAITMGEFAKLIYNETRMGRNSLFKWLRDNKVLNANNIPYQRYVEYGWFKLVEKTFSTTHASHVSIQTLVTGKGQIGLLKQLQKL